MLGRHSHALQQREIQVVEWSAILILDVSPGSEGARSATSQQHGEVVVVVGVAIADSGSVDNLATVQQ